MSRVKGPAHALSRNRSRLLICAYLRLSLFRFPPSAPGGEDGEVVAGGAEGGEVGRLEHQAVVFPATRALCVDLGNGSMPTGRGRTGQSLPFAMGIRPASSRIEI